MKTICSLDKCTGRYACVNACPKQCISMQPLGRKHHLYPVVDESKCINCNLCERVCQVNRPVDLVPSLKAFAGWHKKTDEYHSCNSGGAATAISQNIIRQGGVVYGCSCLEGIDIKHVRIDKEDNLYLLKGSKYVQSTIGHSYTEAQKDLKAGKKVLFIGTPCQIGGLKKFLRIDFDNLITVDLICHGTPSLYSLRKHVEKVAELEGSVVSFRKGNDFGLCVMKKSTTLYYCSLWRNRFSDAYFSTFIDGYTYRDSCYTCKYACPQRVSDITIGDFWGIGSDFNYDTINGCSCMLPNTRKGMELLQTSDLFLFERPTEEAVAGNAQLRHPVTKDFRKKLFDCLFPIMGIKKAYLLCELDHVWQKKYWSRIKNKLHRYK